MVWRRASWLVWLVCVLWAPVSHALPQTIAMAERTPLEPPGPVQQVALPDAWNAQGLQGRWRYDFTFQAPGAAQEPWALYVPRAGNRFEVQLNGRMVGSFGRFSGDLSDYSQRPHYVALPPEWIEAGANRLTMIVQGEKARYAGVSQLHVGPAEEVRRAFLRREVLQTWGSFVTVVLALVLGTLSAGLAAMTRERTLVLFALACAFCALRNCYSLVVTPPFDARLWSWLLDSCYAGYLVCLCGFVTQAVGARGRGIVVATVLMALATVVLVPWHAYGRSVAARQVWTMTMVLYALGLCLLVIRAWIRERSQVNAVLAAAGAVSVALALYDHVLVFYSKTGYGAFALARYSLLIFMLAMAWIVMLRYLERARQEHMLREQMAQELVQKTAELSQQFEIRQQLVQQTAHQRERQRLMQDLHDSMGLQLSGLLAMVERGEVQRQALTTEVRTTIEQMRMLVDSGDDFDGDLAQLLGHVRYRIQTRLSRCGILLDWQSQLPEQLPPFDAARALSLQRIIFELCTNVIRHARAQRVRVDVSWHTEAAVALLLRFEDDGIGYDPANTIAGVGTISLRRRVEDLGGELAVVSDVRFGTAYTLVLPLAA